MAVHRRVDIDVSTLADRYISSKLSLSDADRVKTLIVRSLMSNGLTKTQREYLILRYQQGMTCEQIAKIYSVNKSTVSRTVRRARERIAKALSLRAVSEDFYKYLKNTDA